MLDNLRAEPALLPRDGKTMSRRTQRLIKATYIEKLWMDSVNKPLIKESFGIMMSLRASVWNLWM